MAKPDAKGSSLIKIAVVGPESSGKTFLAEKLSLHFKCLWAPEYAREYLHVLKKAYTKKDVEKIAKGQLKIEDESALKSKSLLICDTNLLVIKIWMEHKYGEVPKWIEAEIVQRNYHLHLLTAPDIPYEPDPLREHPELREYFFEKYQLLLEEIEAEYVIISGSSKKRIATAKNAVGKFYRGNNFNSP